MYPAAGAGDAGAGRSCAIDHDQQQSQQLYRGSSSHSSSRSRAEISSRSRSRSSSSSRSSSVAVAVAGAGAGAGAVAAAAARAVAVAVAVVAVAVAVAQPKCWAQVESAAWVQETGFRHFARAVGQDSEAFLYPPNTKDLGSVPVGWRAGRGGGDRPRLAGHRAADRGGRPRGGARMQRQKGQQGR